MANNSTQMKINDKPFLSASEWAKKNGMCRQTVSRAFKNGQIPGVRVNRRILIPCDWMQDSLKQGAKT